MVEKSKILLVDDEAIVRESLTAWLEDEGFHVLAAESGEQALGIIAEQTVDAAVLDIKMPGMDGLTLLKKLRETDESLPIVMITAYVTIESAVQSMRDGAYDYIMKPFPPEKLTNLLKNILEHQQLMRTLEQFRASCRVLESWFEKTKEIVTVSETIVSQLAELNAHFQEVGPAAAALLSKFHDLEISSERMQGINRELIEMRAQIEHSLNVMK